MKCTTLCVHYFLVKNVRSHDWPGILHDPAAIVVPLGDVLVQGTAMQQRRLLVVVLGVGKSQI